MGWGARSAHQSSSLPRLSERSEHQRTERVVRHPGQREHRKAVGFSRPPLHEPWGLPRARANKHRPVHGEPPRQREAPLLPASALPLSHSAPHRFNATP